MLRKYQRSNRAYFPGMPRAEEMPLRHGLMPQFERFVKSREDDRVFTNQPHHQPPPAMYSPPRTLSNGSAGSNMSSCSTSSMPQRVTQHHSHPTTIMFPSYDMQSVKTQGSSGGQRKRKVDSSRHMTTCTVCGDVAPEHVHYGSVTCFSCRAFFRRYKIKLITHDKNSSKKC